VTLPAFVIAVALAAATSVHLPVSTNDPQAQSAFDRGLFLYYAYDGEAATAAFNEAAARDPALAMAYWGMALAAGPDLNTPLTEQQFAVAQRAVKRALLLPPGDERERTFVAIMARRYAGTFAGWQAGDAAYRTAMTAFAQSSGDENARLLAAEALQEHGDSREALALDAGVLRDDPSNPMANHLCIHLYDLAADRRPALPCAQRLDAANFPPEAEHLAHMPAHYWIETGNYTAALASSERAYALLAQLEGIAGGERHVHQYLKHDVAVGYSAAMMLGNYGVAQRWAQRMEMAYDSSFDALTALRFGRYAQAYAAPDSSFGDPSVGGLAALHLGRLSEARAIAAAMVRVDATRGYLPPIFLARVAEAGGQFSEARRRLAQAAAEQRGEFAGELIPFLPAAEALGFLELRRGDHAAAADAFAQTLELYPNDPRALYGLAAASAADAQTARASEARAKFEREWEGADTTLNGDDLP
jgi:tetratricopeptide (TPR) repeat protein